MTTDREILEQYRAELEERIKDLFIWALGESAITEMTPTVRDNHPYKNFSEPQEKKMKQLKTSGHGFNK